MKSQVSFEFDGEHNKDGIANILRMRLTGVRYKFKTIDSRANLHRVFVASDDKEKTFEVCRGIQCFCVWDNSEKL